MSLIEELVEIERQFWRAAGDPDFYRSRFADDGVMAFHVGVLSKRDVLAAMDGAEAWERFTIEQPVCVDVGQDVASLTYTTTARPLRAATDYRAAITSVYAKRDGEWKLIVHQQTPLAD